EKRAVALADNRLAELGSWNIEMLRLELKELTADTPELAFDYTITGFDTGEIDHVLSGEGSAARPDPADQMLAPADTDAVVTQPGDLWICGNHRLCCGSARSAAQFSRGRPCREVPAGRRACGLNWPSDVGRIDRVSNNDFRLDSRQHRPGCCDLLLCGLAAPRRTRSGYTAIFRQAEGSGGVV